jgi:hypothetical protein
MFWKERWRKEWMPAGCRAISAELDGLLWGASRVVDGGVQWCSFERGCDAHASSDSPGGHDDPGGRPGHGSTLRSPVSGLLPEVGGGWLHRHRLQLYIIGSVQDDGVGTLSYVLRQPILAAGIAGRRPSATRPRLLGTRMLRNSPSDWPMRAVAWRSATRSAAALWLFPTTHRSRPRQHGGGALADCLQAR